MACSGLEGAVKIDILKSRKGIGEPPNRPSGRRRLCAVRAFCRRQNLGAGGIHFRRACESISGNPWSACAPWNRPDHDGPHDVEDVHSQSRFLSYIQASMGPSSGAGAPRANRRCPFYADFPPLSSPGEAARAGTAGGRPPPYSSSLAFLLMNSGRSLL